ncbi:PRC-barrel domain-containing protein [Halorubrum halodurans]|uniref:PRC-barrel domain-containing protein n=1 Tax=Halorubrum halodurans TaxID=1383851 RepID=UPI0015C5DE53|nr:PRC-barrel domain-containing protein [Halorubrum halodurans]
MSTVLASALPEKPVLSADGRKLGTVHNLTIDPRSGDFETLLVAPGPDGVDPDEILPDTTATAERTPARGRNPTRPTPTTRRSGSPATPSPRSAIR